MYNQIHKKCEKQTKTLNITGGFYIYENKENYQYDISGSNACRVP